MMQTSKYIPPLAFSRLDGAVTTSTNNYYNNNNSNNNVNLETTSLLSPPEIPTTRGPRHVDCNTEFASNVKESNNSKNIISKKTAAPLRSPPSRPPSRFTTPRVDLNTAPALDYNNKNYVHKESETTILTTNHDDNLKNERRVENISPANSIVFNINTASTTPIFTSLPSSSLKDERKVNDTLQANKNQIDNEIAMQEVYPNSNSLRWSVVNSEPSITFRIHNDQQDENDKHSSIITNNNSNISLYKLNTMNGARETYMPFQITRENSPALTILNIQSVEDNNLFSRMSSDIHFMLEDAKAKSSINSYRNDHLTSARVLNSHVIATNKEDLSKANGVSNNLQNYNNNNINNNNNIISSVNNSKISIVRGNESIASSIHFVENNADSDNNSNTQNWTNETNVNEAQQEQEYQEHEQLQKQNVENPSCAFVTPVPTLKLNKVNNFVLPSQECKQSTSRNKEKIHHPTIQSARTRSSYADRAPKIVYTTRSASNNKGRGDDKGKKALVPANAVSARLLASNDVTVTGAATTTTTTKAATTVIVDERGHGAQRPVIPSSGNAFERLTISARGKITSRRSSSPFISREFRNSNNVKNNVKEQKDVERIRHNAHYERPWRATPRSLSLQSTERENQLQPEHDTENNWNQQQQEQQSKRKISWEPSSNPLRLPPLRFSGKPLVSFHDQWITHHRRPPASIRQVQRLEMNKIDSISGNNNNTKVYSVTSNNNAEIKQKIAKTLDAKLERDSHGNFINTTFLRQINTPQSQPSHTTKMEQQEQEREQEQWQEHNEDIVKSVNDGNIAISQHNRKSENLLQMNAVHFYTPRPRANYNKPWRADIATPRGQRRDVWRDAFINEGNNPSYSKSNNNDNNNDNNNNNNIIERSTNTENTFPDNTLQFSTPETGTESLQREVKEDELYNNRPREQLPESCENNEYVIMQENDVYTNPRATPTTAPTQRATLVDSRSNVDDVEALPRASEETPLPHPRTSQHSRESLSATPEQSNQKHLSETTMNSFPIKLSDTIQELCEREEEQQQQLEEQHEYNIRPAVRTNEHLSNNKLILCDSNNNSNRNSNNNNSKYMLENKLQMMELMLNEVEDWMECVTQERNLEMIQEVDKMRETNLQNAFASFEKESNILRQVTEELYNARDTILHIQDEQQEQEEISTVNTDADRNSNKYVNKYDSKNNDNSECTTSDHVNYIIHHPPQEDEANNSDISFNINNTINVKESLSISPFDVHKLKNEFNVPNMSRMKSERVQNATRQVCQAKWAAWETERQQLLQQLQRLRQQHRELHFHLHRGTHIKSLMLNSSDQKEIDSLIEDKSNSRRTSLEWEEEEEEEEEYEEHAKKLHDIQDENRKPVRRRGSQPILESEFSFEAQQHLIASLRLEAQQCAVSLARAEQEWQLLRRRSAEHKQELLNTLHHVQDQEAVELSRLHRCVREVEQTLAYLVSLRTEIYDNTIMDATTRRRALMCINDELQHGEEVLNLNKNRLLSMERRATSLMKIAPRRESIEHEC